MFLKYIDFVILNETKGNEESQFRIFEIQLNPISLWRFFLRQNDKQNV